MLPAQPALRPSFNTINTNTTNRANSSPTTTTTNSNSSDSNSSVSYSSNSSSNSSNSNNTRATRWVSQVELKKNLWLWGVPRCGPSSLHSLWCMRLARESALASESVSRERGKSGPAWAGAGSEIKPTEIMLVWTLLGCFCMQVCSVCCPFCVLWRARGFALALSHRPRARRVEPSTGGMIALTVVPIWRLFVAWF